MTQALPLRHPFASRRAFRGFFISAVQRMNPESMKNQGTQVNPQLHMYLAFETQEQHGCFGDPSLAG